MMNKEISPRAKAAHLIWALPVLVLLLAAFAQPEYQTVNETSAPMEGKEVALSALVLDPGGEPVPGAKVLVKGKKASTSTNKAGEFSLKAGSSDIIIVRQKGYKDAVVHMEKVVAKNGDSDHYKFKVKLEKANAVAWEDMSKDEQIKELEIMLKDLSMKQKELDKKKAKLAELEKAGEIDQETLDKKKMAVIKEYKMIKEKTAKVEAKLKHLKQS